MSHLSAGSRSDDGSDDEAAEAMIHEPRRELPGVDSDAATDAPPGVDAASVFVGEVGAEPPGRVLM